MGTLSLDIGKRKRGGVRDYTMKLFEVNLSGTDTRDMPANGDHIRIPGSDLLWRVEVGSMSHSGVRWWVLCSLYAEGQMGEL